MCVALQPGPHGDGRYIVVNVTDGGKVRGLCSIIGCPTGHRYCPTVIDLVICPTGHRFDEL